MVRDYLRTSVLQNESTVNSLILFFASYFDAPYEGADLNTFFNHIARTSYTTMRSELDDFRQQVIDTRTRKMVTIQNEVLRSAQEVEIANFLYLNGIDYEYEPIYPYHIQFARKPYTPDFRLRQDEHTAYLEHFGITEDGRNDRYTPEQEAAYRQAVNDKIGRLFDPGTGRLCPADRFLLRRHITQSVFYHPRVRIRNDPAGASEEISYRFPLTFN